MNVFERHATANEQQAKAALVRVAVRTIGKYIIAQQVLNQVLTGGIVGEKGQSCLLCKVDKLTKVMSKLEMQVGQLTKTYDLLFDEELDVKSITKDAISEHYPLMDSSSVSSVPSVEDIVKSVFSKGRSTSDSSDVEFPEGTPQEVKDITSAIQGIIGKSGKNLDFRVIDLTSKEGVMGLNPQDFANFEDFWKAVKAKSKKTKNSSEISEDSEERTKKSTSSSKDRSLDSKGVSDLESSSSSKSTPSSNGTEGKPKDSKN